MKKESLPELPLPVDNHDIQCKTHQPPFKPVSENLDCKISNKNNISLYLVYIRIADNLDGTVEDCGWPGSRRVLRLERKLLRRLLIIGVTADNARSKTRRIVGSRSMLLVAQELLALRSSKAAEGVVGVCGVWRRWRWGHSDRLQ